MNAVALTDPVLMRFRAALDDMYGDRLVRVMLFGSRARGDGQPDADYDVAVFLHSIQNRGQELHRLADLRVRFIDEAGAFFDTKPYPANAFEDRTPLMHEIRRDGHNI